MAVVAQKVNFSQALPLGGVRQAVGADDVGQPIRQGVFPKAESQAQPPGFRGELGI